MKFRILILSLLWGASNPLFAGGGSDGPSRTQLWETFNNPLAEYPVEKTLSDNTIRRLVRLLEEDSRKGQAFDFRTTSEQWGTDASFQDALVELVKSSGRDLVINRGSRFDTDGCLQIAQSRIPHTLFKEGLTSGHEEVVSERVWTDDGSADGFRVPREDVRRWETKHQANPGEFREWLRSADKPRHAEWYGHIMQAWNHLIRGYYWTCQQTDPTSEAYPDEYQQLPRSSREFFPSQEEYEAALPLVKGTKIHQFLENYRRFLNAPTPETARYLAANETRELVARHTSEGQMPRYEQLAASARTFLAQTTDNTLEFPGGLPLDTPGWGPCVSAGTLRGTLQLAQEWLGDNSLSDFSVRNALLYRFNIAAQCQNKAVHTLTERELQSIPGPWRAYLVALEFFYGGEYRRAGDAFADLVGAEPDYVAELSSYMAGRAFHIAAQHDWSGYGEPAESVDKELLEKSERHFRQHMERGGRYADSARGLLRRNAYLAGAMENYYAELERHLDRLLERKPDESTADRIIQVVDEGSRFGHGSALLESLDKKYQFIVGDDRLKAISPLLDFRRGVQRFHAGDLQAAYEQLLKTGFEPAYPYLVRIAQQLDDRQRLASVYREFLEGNTRAMYLTALDYAEQGATAFINTDSAALAKQSASAHCSVGTLHQLVTGNLRNKHVSELRDALYDAYIQREEFGKLHQLISSGDLDNGPYEAIRTAVRQLARGESLGKAYMNIGYFVATRLEAPAASGAYNFLVALDADRYCDGRLKSYARGAQYFYQRSIAQFSPDDRSEDEAKALHFMINCDRKGRRGCWGARPGDAESPEVLFERLHGKYPDNQWAKKTPYYY